MSVVGRAPFIDHLSWKVFFLWHGWRTGKLVDILPSRKKVHYIVTDMNAPYFSLIKECFPKAQAIVDCFHIIQHLNKCFNRVWIRIMKQLDQKDWVQAKQYRQLKSLHKMLLKPAHKLDYSTF